MEDFPHVSAKPSHYDDDAREYDTLNEKNSQELNGLLDGILKKYKAKTVFDLTCGTGSQVFYLAKRGYVVTGADINVKMLEIARSKVEDLDVRFLQGDMRSVQLGKFDAAITIFNAVGHLTKSDFEKAMRNIHENLQDGGLYIFDIFNLSYLLEEDNITKLTIDWQKDEGKKRVRKVQYSTVNKEGVLASYTTSFLQEEGSNEVLKDKQTLQIYSAEQLQEMLKRSGFEVVEQLGADGAQFIEDKTERILIAALKV